MVQIWTMGELIVEIMRPEPNIPLYEAGTFLGPYPSGAPAIFIDAAARLGKKAGIIASVGDDDFGRCCTDRLENHGVDCRFVRRTADVSTGCAFVTYFDDGTRQFIFHMGNSAAADIAAPGPRDIPDGPGFFHVMGCSVMAHERMYREIVKAMRGFADKGYRVSFDPNIRPELLQGRSMHDVAGPVMEICNVLLPGVDELLRLSGCDTAEAAAEKLFRNPALEIIAMKKGSQGCQIFTRDGSFALGVYPTEVVDPTGAGDCFDAGFLCGLLDGLSPEGAGKLASAAASLNTSAFGPMEGDISMERVLGLTGALR